MDTLLYIVGWIIVFETGFFAMKSSQFLLPVGDKRWQKVILFFAYVLTITMVIYIGDPVNLPPTIMGFMAAVMISCKGTLLQRFTVGLMFVSTSSAFNALYDNLIQNHTNVPGTILKLIFWCMFYVLMRHFSPPKNYELSPALWKLILLLTIIPIGITCSVVLLTSPYYELNDAAKWAFSACLFFALFSFIGLMWTIIVLAKQRKMELETMMSEINQPDAEKSSYLDQLVKSPAMESRAHYCNDSTVNAVLGAKTSVMERSQIKFTVNIDIAAQLPFEKVDLCAVIANALDNAIEACVKLPTTSREIEVRSRAQKGMFVLNVTNPLPKDTAEFTEASEHLPSTTKKDKSCHGYGLKSILEIVTRYGGNMEITTEDEKFELFVYLPMES